MRPRRHKEPPPIFLPHGLVEEIESRLHGAASNEEFHAILSEAADTFVAEAVKRGQTGMKNLQRSLENYYREEPNARGGAWFISIHEKLEKALRHRRQLLSSSATSFEAFP